MPSIPAQRRPGQSPERPSRKRRATSRVISMPPPVGASWPFSPPRRQGRQGTPRAKRGLVILSAAKNLVVGMQQTTRFFAALSMTMLALAYGSRGHFTILATLGVLGALAVKLTVVTRERGDDGFLVHAEVLDEEGPGVGLLFDQL